MVNFKRLDEAHRMREAFRTGYISPMISQPNECWLEIVKRMREVLDA
jgi:hypothetical protein